MPDNRIEELSTLAKELIRGSLEHKHDFGWCFAEVYNNDKDFKEEEGFTCGTVGCAMGLAHVLLDMTPAELAEGYEEADDYGLTEYTDTCHEEAFSARYNDVLGFGWVSKFLQSTRGYSTDENTLPYRDVSEKMVGLALIRRLRELE